ncbi:hypothetical protein ED733_004021 [Metarhizium rileyi]|uniref:EKC/KEOPS complex subunit BUD32 n=1 Tax=Metarhizium rileyi (strain RCEF 4871) TaxID=1649241 RepID=A0A5C6G8S7_METRR|nr:hypothetical protein ED733_004021 [Metarhizium rileyi]
MARLTSKEMLAIEKSPLGDSLSMIRETLRKAEASLEADDGNNESGPPRLFLAAINTLFHILSCSDVSFTLASRTGRDFIASDLIVLRMRLYRGEFEHDLFRPLTQLVITPASDIDIWTAIIALIRTISHATPPPSLPLSFDTSTTHSSASQPGSENTCRKIEPRVFEEVRHCTHRAVGGFHEKYFEGRPWSRRASRIYKASQDFYDKDKGRWKGLPTGATEDDVCKWWLGLQCDLLDKERAAYLRSSNKRVGGEAQRHLDLFVKTKAAINDEKHAWKDVLVVGELKKADQMNEGLWLQVGGAVRHVFTYQPTRRFVHAFTLTGTEMETWVFDRSGPFSGAMFDIHNEPEKFIQVLCGYLMMNDEEYGVDTFLKQKDHKLFVTIPTNTSDKTRRQKFELYPVPIAIQRAIVCRGTSCFMAKAAGANEFDTVMKFSWTSSLRKPEADLLNKACERGVKGIARVVGYQEEITSIKELRASLAFAAPYKLRGTPHSNDTSFSQSQPPASQSSSDIHGLSPMRSASRKRRCSDSASHAKKRLRPSSQLAVESKHNEGSITYAIHEPEGTRLVGREELPFENRILRVLAISPPGQPVSQFKSIVDLIEAMRDAIKAHRSLFIDGKILHRDISENNIIITDPNKAGGFHGMLIDLDLAKEDGKEPSRAHRRTGTLEFMAIEVLFGIAHTYRHDVEAFFYVLLWLCARRGWAMSTKSEQRPEKSMLTRWYSGTYEEIGQNKRGDMDKFGLNMILNEFPSAFDIVRPLCRKIRDILFPHKDGLFTGTPSDPDVLYVPIIEAYDDTLIRLKKIVG